ncbi:hypothetical protein ACJX0J_017598 [Zea mays]
MPPNIRKTTALLILNENSFKYFKVFYSEKVFRFTVVYKTEHTTHWVDRKNFVHLPLLAWHNLSQKCAYIVEWKIKILLKIRFFMITKILQIKNILSSSMLEEYFLTYHAQRGSLILSSSMLEEYFY